MTIRFLYLLILILPVCGAMHAQKNWIGTTDSWTDDANWSPSGQPNSDHNVIISSGAPNWPKLSGPVEINSLTMNAGSQLDVNGSKITATGAISITGSTVSNTGSGPATMETKGGSSYLRNSVFANGLDFTATGGAVLNEADVTGPNTYDGNVKFTIANSNTHNFSAGYRSVVNGNLVIERTVAGITNVLTNGSDASTAVMGDFSYTNKAGGATVIGGVTGKTIIEGKVDIEVETTGSNPAFTLQRLANNTTGGVISILNPGGFNLYNDTLTVAGFTVAGKKFSNSNIDLSKLTFGTFLYEDDPANNAPLYISRSEFNGPAVFTLKGVASFNEGWNGPNTYNGNTVFKGAGQGELNVSGWSRSLFNGDLAIERTVAGTTNGLTSGAASSTAVTGNFSYINKAGGVTVIGGGTGKAIIEGKVNIEVETTSSNPAFTLQRLANNTTGGVISILNPGGFNLYNDTLTVAGFTVAGKKFSNSNIDLSKLTFGTFLYEDDPANNAPLYISRSEFNGPAVFTLKGVASFNEGWNGPNTYNGNTVFKGAGQGELNVSGWSRSLFNGDLAIERTVAGTTNVLTNDAPASTAVTGDFSYGNKIGGSTTIGGTSGKTIIEGKVDIEVETTGSNPAFTLQRLANNTDGGVVSILNPGAFNLLNDTLIVASFTVSGKQFVDSNVNYSKLTSGSFLYEDAAGNNAPLYMSHNEFNGPAAFTLNGSGSFNDGWVGPNQYNGNVTYTRNGSGNIVIGSSFVLSYAANLTFASAAGIIVNAPGRVRFNGATDGSFTHTGVAEPVLPGFILEKTEGAKLVLGQPLRTSNTVSFVSGYIQASETNPLIFQGGTNHTGTSDDSHVLGPVHKIGNTEFTFPIGSGEKLFAAGISAPSSPTDRFSAEFLAHNPGDDSYDPDEKAGTLTKVFDGGYWDIQPVAPTTGNVTVTLGYNFPSGYISDPSKLAVAHWNGTLWDDLGNGGTSGSNTVGTVSTAAAVPAFSPFTIASTEDANPLPVVLAGFSASKEGAAAVLRWTTTDEANSDRFEIEHSTDARMWSMIGKIAAKQERNIISDYTYIHTNPFTGINYYRLKMVDQDGSFAYSRVEKVTFPGGATLVLYPNPVSERLFMRPIAAAGTGKAEIYTVAGRRVWSGDMPALQEGLDISGLPGGLYLVRVSGPGTQVETVRVLVER